MTRSGQPIPVVRTLRRGKRYRRCTQLWVRVPNPLSILESERKVRAGLSHFNGVKTGGKRKLAAKQVELKRESAESSVLETRNSNV